MYNTGKYFYLKDINGFEHVVYEFPSNTFTSTSLYQNQITTKSQDIKLYKINRDTNKIYKHEQYWVCSQENKNNSIAYVELKGFDNFEEIYGHRNGILSQIEYIPLDEFFKHYPDVGY